MLFDRNSIVDAIKDMLSPDRFEHTLGVESEAIALAKAHGESPERASLAALLHDCGRALSRAELRNEARKLKLTDPILSAASRAGWRAYRPHAIQYFG